MTHKLNKGVFVALEGIDGSGKTSLGKALAQALRDLGFDAVYTHEAGGTEFGAKVRSLVLESDIDTITSLCLFSADRRHHVETFIKPALAENKIVICDRYVDTTRVYQGFSEEVEAMIKMSTGDLKPDLTFWCKVSPAIAYERIKDKNKDRYENSEALIEYDNRYATLYDLHWVFGDNSVVFLDAECPVTIVKDNALAWVLLLNGSTQCALYTP